jgi:hypothetical protein
MAAAHKLVIKSKVQYALFDVTAAIHVVLFHPSILHSGKKGREFSVLKVLNIKNVLNFRHQSGHVVYVFPQKSKSM